MTVSTPVVEMVETGAGSGAIAQVDGHEAPVNMAVRLYISGDWLRADFDGTSGMSGFGVNFPEVYTRAYACCGLKCAIAPEVPNNTGSRDPFEITAPESCIQAAPARGLPMSACRPPPSRLVFPP